MNEIHLFESILTGATVRYRGLCLSTAKVFGVLQAQLTKISFFETQIFLLSSALKKAVILSPGQTLSTFHYTTLDMHVE